MRGKPNAFPGPLNAWWNWRCKRTWVLGLLVAYTAVGFLVVPWLVKRELVNGIDRGFGLPAAVEAIRFNPWTLTLEVEGFTLRDGDDAVIVGFDDLRVNAQTSSVFRRALTFREITLIRPFGSLVRRADGGLNVDPILAGLGPGAPDPEAGGGAGAPRLLVHELAIEGGVIEVTDALLETPFVASIGPIDIHVTDLTTLPDLAGEQSVSVRTPRGTELSWSGTVELEPFASTGRVTGHGPYMPLLYQYFQDAVAFELTEGDVELAFDYAVNIDSDEGLRADVANAQFVLRGTSLVLKDAAGAARRIASFPELSLLGGAFSWPEQRVRIDSVAVTDPEILAWRDAEGVLSTSRLLIGGPSDDSVESASVEDAPPEGGGAAETSPPADAESGPTWDVAVAILRVDGARATFNDRSVGTSEAPGVINVTRLDLKVEGVTADPGGAFPSSARVLLGSGGELRLVGTLRVLPEASFEGEVSVADLALVAIQPWLATVARVAIDSGTLALEGALQTGSREPFGFQGTLSVADLGIVDVLHEEPLLGWERLTVDRLELSGGRQGLEVGTASFAAPYGRLRIEADHSTNVGQLAMTTRDEATEPEPDSPPSGAGNDGSGALAVSIGEIVVADGAADFSDLSLPLPFAARISELDGNVVAVSSWSKEPARVELEGKVGEFGYFETGGELTPLDPIRLMNLSVLFRNLEMPQLSPYTVKFAGRAIDDGRMDLDLRYRLQDGRLAAQNGITLRKLELGERVDQPGAADLPLDLAVALLKGPDGVIDIDLPVSGDVRDPTFSIGGVVTGALGKLLTGLVTSPFRLLGKLVGVESESFDTIEFRPGSAVLTPPEQEKLGQLTAALELRPSLKLKVGGVSDPDADGAALRRARVAAAIDAELSAESEGADAELLIERRRVAVERLARAGLPSLDLATLRDAHQVPRDPERPDGQKTLDVAAYITALEARLVEAQPEDQAELGRLANARAQAVSEALSGLADAAARIVVVAPDQSRLDDAGWIPMRLKLEH